MDRWNPKKQTGAHYHSLRGTCLEAEGSGTGLIPLLTGDRVRQCAKGRKRRSKRAGDEGPGGKSGSGGPTGAAATVHGVDEVLEAIAMARRALEEHQDDPLGGRPRSRGVGIPEWTGRGGRPALRPHRAVHLYVFPANCGFFSGTGH